MILFCFFDFFYNFFKLVVSMASFDLSNKIQSLDFLLSFKKILELESSHLLDIHYYIDAAILQSPPSFQWFLNTIFYVKSCFPLWLQYLMEIIIYLKIIFPNNPKIIDEIASTVIVYSLKKMIDILTDNISKILQQIFIWTGKKINDIPSFLALCIRYLIEHLRNKISKDFSPNTNAKLDQYKQTTAIKISNELIFKTFYIIIKSSYQFTYKPKISFTIDIIFENFVVFNDLY